MSTPRNTRILANPASGNLLQRNRHPGHDIGARTIYTCESLRRIGISGQSERIIIVIDWERSSCLSEAWSLDALASSAHADDTIIVLWSDHGDHQGEKRSFRKFALWNVIDADRPEQLKKFKNQQWPEWKRKLKPALE